MKIYTLGPAGTSSHEAALKIFPKQNILLSPNFDDLFSDLQAHSEDIGLVPIENSLHGSVDEVLDLLIETGMKIWRMEDFTIHYAFGAIDASQVKRVASHPQALAHCKPFLRKEYPHVEHFPVSSTAYAIELGLKDKTIGVIARKEAMRERGYPIIQEEIQRKGDTTRFGIVSKKDPFPEQKRERMMIVLHPTEDRPGLLHDMLVPFKVYDLNLTRIESRPAGTTFGDYIFFIDFMGSPNDARTKSALKDLSKIATVDILGQW